MPFNESPDSAEIAPEVSRAKARKRKHFRLARVLLAPLLCSATGLAIVLTTGDDTHTGTSGADVIYCGSGNDVVSGAGGSDLIVGEGGSDTLDGGDGADILFGGGLYGQADGSSNILIGGGGDDFLYGGQAADEYRYDAGEGKDLIREGGVGSAGEDILTFGPGVDPLDLTYARERGDLVLYLDNVEVVRIASWFGSENGENRVEKLVFDDSSVMLASGFAFDGTLWTGTSAADTQTAATNGNYQMLGLAGGDTLTGGGGNDVIIGGDGNDTLYGGAGNDALYGGAGQDSMYGNDGDDYLEGGAVNETLTGGAGNDTLVGGDGGDLLMGGSGNDTYVWNLGDGDDLIEDAYTENTAGIENHLYLGPGIEPSDITTEQTLFTYLKFNVVQSGIAVGTFRISNWFYSSSGRHNTTWRIHFANGTIWDGRYLATGGADTLSGGSGVDELRGGGGNDNLSGLAGDDHLWGDGGNDTLNGGDGADTLEGGSENDTLNGDAGDDILIGGPGGDFLYGGAGNDSYYWYLGDGDDTISDDFNANTAGIESHLYFGPGISPLQVVTEQQSTSLKLTVMQGAQAIGSVRIYNWFYTSNGRHHNTWRIHFADGTLWDGRYLGTAGADTLSGSSSADVIYGAAGNDNLSGNAGNDTLYGEAGTDTLYGGNDSDALWGGADADTLSGDDGNDLLIGGLGNDILMGGNGSDEYRWAPGDGSDTISDTYLETTAVNKLTLQGLSSPTLVDFARSGSYALQVIVTNPTPALGGTIQINDWSRTMSGFYHYKAWRLNLEGFGEFTFANETSTGNDTYNGTTGGDALIGWSGNDTLDGLAGADFLHGGAGADTLKGGDGADLLLGGAGDDTLYGYGATPPSGSTGDTFYGGPGADSLRGTDGNDIYQVELGFGAEEIVEPAGNSTGEANEVRFGAGIDPDHVVVTRSGNDLLVEYQSGGGVVTIRDWFADPARLSAVELIRFQGGYQWSRAFVEGRVGRGAASAESQEPEIADPLDPEEVEDELDNHVPPSSSGLEVFTPLQ